MTDEIAALRREVAELRQAVSGMRARVEVLELREQLRELQHPKFMPYQFVGPDGRGWAAAYCPIELWPGIAASADVRALSPVAVGMQEASDLAAQLKLCFNRLAGIAELPRC